MIILVHILSWGLPLAVLIAVPTLIILRVVRFARSEAGTGRKVFAVAGAVVAVPVVLIVCLLLEEAISIAGLKVLGKAVGTEDKTKPGIVEQRVP